MKKDENLKLIMIASMIVLAAATRFLPTAPNFTPMIAIALFGGAMIKNKYMAAALPLSAMLLSDIFIGFHSTIPAVYLSIVLAIFAGRMIKNNKNILNIAGGSLISAVLFFLITNFGAWLAIGTYTKDLAGLMQAYQMGIPFFRNTILSTGLFSTALFGAYALVEKFIPELDTNKA